MDSSFTSFENYFSNVFNDSSNNIKRHKKQKKSKQINNKYGYYYSSSIKSQLENTNENENEVENENRNKNDIHKLLHTKKRKNKGLSNIKLRMKQKAKLISAKKRKIDLSQELIALGINPKNMSIMKQKKSLKKALERMSNSKSSTIKTTDNSSNNSLSALFSDDIPQNTSVLSSNIHSKQKKRKRNNAMTLDLQFGTLIKSDDVFAKQIQEENFIRYGKSGKSITDRHLLRELKAREKRINVVFKKYKNEHKQHMIIDEHLTQNMVNKIKGKRVKERNLQYLKKKLKMKHKKKMKSRREWKVRLQKKKRVYSMKVKKRNENLEKYSSKKILQRIGHRMTDQQLINISSTL